MHGIRRVLLERQAESLGLPLEQIILSGEASIEEYLSKIGMKAVFPLWRRDTAELAQSFVDLGFKAIVTCVDSRILDKTFAGRMIDDSFLAMLPPNVDPCGENGEFHSFAFDGPMFKWRITFTVGQIVSRDSFYFCDLVPD
jgi:uncharacterized protein (TIGR00290 family)